MKKYILTAFAVIISAISVDFILAQNQNINNGNGIGRGNGNGIGNLFSTSVIQLINEMRVCFTSQSFSIQETFSQATNTLSIEIMDQSPSGGGGAGGSLSNPSRGDQIQGCVDNYNIGARNAISAPVLVATPLNSQGRN